MLGRNDLATHAPCGSAPTAPRESATQSRSLRDNRHTGGYAGNDAYLTLPARNEGIVPGAANLRLTRFVGDRMARQLVMMDRRLECASPEGRLICDQVVAPERVESAVAEVIERITSSGVVSAASNRRAFRMAHEPLSLFRQYMAVYARDQVYCHFSPALIQNLETHWKADQR